MCKGKIYYEPNDEISLEDFLYSEDFCGVKIDIEDISPYKTFEFYGKKEKLHGQPTVIIFNNEGKVLAELKANYGDLNGEWERFTIDVSEICGSVTILLNGCYIDKTGNSESSYTFSSIGLY